MTAMAPPNDAVEVVESLIASTRRPNSKIAVQMHRLLYDARMGDVWAALARRRLLHLPDHDGKPFQSVSVQGASIGFHFAFECFQLLNADERPRTESERRRLIERISSLATELAGLLEHDGGAMARMLDTHTTPAAVLRYPDAPLALSESAKQVVVNAHGAQRFPKLLRLLAREAGALTPPALLTTTRNWRRVCFRRGLTDWCLGMFGTPCRNIVASTATTVFQGTVSERDVTRAAPVSIPPTLRKLNPPM